MIEIDDVDRAILRRLQEDAGEAVSETAAAVGLPYTGCWRRIRQLERSGIVRRRVALLDDQSVGLGVSVLVSVALGKHDEATLKSFEDAVKGIPEVMECYAIAGEKDYHLRVVVPDVAAYERLLKAKLVNLPGATSVSSAFALSCVKYSTKLPI